MISPSISAFCVYASLCPAALLMNRNKKEKQAMTSNMCFLSLSELYVIT